MRIAVALKAVVTCLPAAVLAGCWASETPVLDAANSIRVPGAYEGRYCHVENRLDPPQVAVHFEVSESLGANKCRDLHFDPESGRYIDSLSPSIELRVGELDAPMYLLQVRSSAKGPARFAPVAVVDGLFVQYDPAGRWPEDLIAAKSLSLTDEGVLAAAPPSDTRDLLQAAFDLTLARIREEVAFVEDADGPRLEFRDINTAYSYIVYVREDWNGDPVEMRKAMVALAEKLGLAKLNIRFARRD